MPIKRLIARKGEDEMQFPSYIAAAEHFKCTRPMLSYHIRGGTAIDGWTLEPVECATRRKPAGPKFARSIKDMACDRCEGSPVSTGYYYPGFGPAICPVCRKVVTGLEKDIATHFTKCLSGRRFTYTGFGTLKLYNDENAD